MLNDFIIVMPDGIPQIIKANPQQLKKLLLQDQQLQSMASNDIILLNENYEQVDLELLIYKSNVKQQSYKIIVRSLKDMIREPYELKKIYEQKLKILNQKLDQKIDENNSLNQLIDVKNMQISQLEEEKQTLTASLQIQDKEKEEILKNSIQQKEEQLKSEKELHTNEIQKLETQYKEKLEQFEKIIQVKSQEITTLNQDSEEQLKNTKKLDQENQQLKQQLQEQNKFISELKQFILKKEYESYYLISQLSQSYQQNLDVNQQKFQQEITQIIQRTAESNTGKVTQINSLEQEKFNLLKENKVLIEKINSAQKVLNE